MQYENSIDGILVISTSLNQAIFELQYAFFGQTERMLADALSVGKHEFLRDPLFQSEFKRICTKLKIVEFYLCSEPDGVLLLNAKGEASLLIVPDEDAVLCQYDIAYDQGAPKELLDALKSNQVISYFWKTAGYYAPECKDWQTFLFPATEFKGKKCYLYTIIENPPLFKTETVFSYHAFLDKLDQQRCSYS